MISLDCNLLTISFLLERLLIQMNIKHDFNLK